MRVWQRVAAALLGFSLSAGVAAVSALPAQAAPATPFSLGVSPGGPFQNQSTTQLAAAFAAMRQSGATWVRLDIDWPAVQAGPGQFNWAVPDRTITAARTAGLQVLALPTYAPSWARLSSGYPSPAAFATFVTAAAGRYGPMGVSAWEIWNEPNFASNWGPRADPASYTSVLEAANGAIKAVEPAATVITGGLAPAADSTSGSTLSPATFLSGIYSSGGQGAFDAVGSHPYSFPDMPMTPDGWNPFYALPALHQIMVNHGDGAKQVWLTEYGAPTGSTSQSVSAAVQAAMVTQAASAASARSWTGPLFWYSWQDAGDATRWDNDMGLLDAAGNAKPALAAFSDAAGSSASAPGSSGSSGTGSSSGSTGPSGSSATSTGPDDTPGTLTGTAGTSTGSAGTSTGSSGASGGSAGSGGGSTSGSSGTSSGPSASAAPTSGGAAGGTGSPAPAGPIVAPAPAPTGAVPTGSPAGGSGYLVATPTGVVNVLGASLPASHVPTASLVGMAGTPDHQGYWTASANGAVQAAGDAANYGSAAGLHLARPIVGMAATPDGAGYWLVASDGGIFSFGDAHFYGSTGAMRLNRPVVGIASTPDGAGYWLVAADGGIFSFGDAPFYGSTGAIRLAKPIVGITTTPDGKGYRFVASDGGIFDFGDAAFYGSTGGMHLTQPIVGMAPTADGMGYWLVAADGSVYSFGDATFHGTVPGPVAAILAG